MFVLLPPNPSRSFAAGHVVVHRNKRRAGCQAVRGPKVPHGLPASLPVHVVVHHLRPTTGKHFAHSSVRGTMSTPCALERAHPSRSLLAPARGGGQQLRRRQRRRQRQAPSTHREQRRCTNTGNESARAEQRPESFERLHGALVRVAVEAQQCNPTRFEKPGLDGSRPAFI